MKATPTLALLQTQDRTHYVSWCVRFFNLVFETFQAGSVSIRIIASEVALTTLFSNQPPLFIMQSVKYTVHDLHYSNKLKVRKKRQISFAFLRQIHTLRHYR